jgi:membrane-bound lytic murein transglycosylase B
MLKIRSFRFSIIFLTLLLGFSYYFFSQTGLVLADTDPCGASITGQSNAQLQAALDACNADIAKWTSILNSVKQDSASFAQDVAALTAKINIAQANIKAKNIAIANLGKDIATKQNTINVLDNKIEQGRATLAEILRKTSQIDLYSLPETILSNKDFSEFFVDVDTYSATSHALENVFAELRGNIVQTQAEKDALKKKQDETANAKAAIELAKKQVEINQTQKKILLAESQNREKTYGQVLAERQAKAAQIRAALFNLRDTAAIPFGTALQYAQEAGAKTGVDPAFLLAIMTQESNLGQNVGACLLTNFNTGDGKGANTGTPKSRVMSPTRDVPIFLDILSKVGGDPYNTRVSCWQPLYSSTGSPIGWGGAMGPAQFIPSTWKLFASRIASLSGHSNPDPWNARDALYASAIYLGDLGADSSNYTSQKNAACRYYSGSSCKTSYANTYGNAVMALATKIQTTMIDPLQGI